jgi:hypothetical protein
VLFWTLSLTQTHKTTISFFSMWRSLQSRENTDWFKWINQWQFIVSMYMLNRLIFRVFLCNKLIEIDKWGMKSKERVEVDLEPVIVHLESPLMWNRLGFSVIFGWFGWFWVI